MNEYQLESFISYCDEMMIVTEGLKFQNFIDNLVDTVTKIAEFFRRIGLKFQAKVKENKCIKLPKDYHKKMQELILRIYDEWESVNESFENIQSTWLGLKSIRLDGITLKKPEYSEECTVMVSLIYKKSINSSKMISVLLNGIKRLKRQISATKNQEEINQYSEDISKFRNQIKLARILMEIDKTYLGFGFEDFNSNKTATGVEESFIDYYDMDIAIRAVTPMAMGGYIPNAAFGMF